MQPVLVQTKSQKEASAVSAWAFPVFGVVSMFACSALLAIRTQRGRQSTRQVNIIDPEHRMEEMDVEPLLVDESGVLE